MPRRALSSASKEISEAEKRFKRQAQSASSFVHTRPMNSPAGHRVHKLFMQLNNIRLLIRSNCDVKNKLNAFVKTTYRKYFMPSHQNVDT